MHKLNPRDNESTRWCTAGEHASTNGGKTGHTKTERDGSIRTYTSASFERTCLHVRTFWSWGVRSFGKETDTRGNSWRTMSRRTDARRASVRARRGMCRQGFACFCSRDSQGAGLDMHHSNVSLGSRIVFAFLSVLTYRQNIIYCTQKQCTLNCFPSTTHRRGVLRQDKQSLSLQLLYSNTSRTIAIDGQLRYVWYVSCISNHL